MSVETDAQYFRVRRSLLTMRQELLQQSTDKEIQQISVIQNELQQLTGIVSTNLRDVAPFCQISFNENEIVVVEGKEAAEKGKEGTANCAASSCLLL